MKALKKGEQFKPVKSSPEYKALIKYERTIARTIEEEKNYGSRFSRRWIPSRNSSSIGQADTARSRHGSTTLLNES